MSERIGFIGLGNLGSPMALNLLDSGHELTVYNRTAGKTELLQQRGAAVATTPIEVVQPGGIIVSVLWDAEAVESVVTSSFFLERLGAGGIHISMCTCLPAAAKRLADLHARHGCTYVEAPVFGRHEAAVAKKLWMPVAGPQSAKDRIRPLLLAMGAQEVFDFGEEIGSATMVKIVGNFLLISATRSLTEALRLIDVTGGDMQAVVNMLTQTLFPSPIYQSYGNRIAERQPTFSQSKIPQKDLGLFEAIAQQHQVPAPMAATIISLLQSGTVA
jgi:3-hydroxyisobutyrate dehydrogenase-like beta-hydroxyacid dehydrogenase